MIRHRRTRHGIAEQTPEGEPLDVESLDELGAATASELRARMIKMHKRSQAGGFLGRSLRRKRELDFREVEVRRINGQWPGINLQSPLIQFETPISDETPDPVVEKGWIFELSDWRDGGNRIDYSRSPVRISRASHSPAGARELRLQYEINPDEPYGFLPPALDPSDPKVIVYEGLSGVLGSQDLEGLRQWAERPNEPTQASHIQTYTDGRMDTYAVVASKRVVATVHAILLMRGALEQLG